MAVPIHKPRVKEVASNKPNGATAFNLPDSAPTGYQSFDTAYASADTCPYFASNPGGDWESGIGTFTAGSPDTLARTTVLSSSTGSAIDWSAGGDVTVSVQWSADNGRRFEQTALSHLAASPTTAGVTGEVGMLHLLDISGLTATRNFTLPTTSAVGDRIGVYLTTGDADYALVIIGGTGITINGGSAATEWSRLFITNEVVIMRCVTANSAWVVEQDGRIPQICDMQLTTECDGEGVNVFVRPTQAATPGAWTAQIDNASLATVAGDRITVRRAGNYLAIASGRAKDQPADGAYYNVGLYKSAGATLVLLGQAVTSATAQNPLASNSREMQLVADDYLVFQYRNAAGGLGCIANQTWFSMKEDL